MAMCDNEPAANRGLFEDLVRKNIKREGIGDLMGYLDKSDFYEAPASTQYHEAYEGGLLEHSLNVYQEFSRLRSAYPEIDVSDETAAIICLFHDLCKVNFYSIEMRNKKIDGAWQSVPFYTTKEKFCYGGHGSKSVFIISQYMKLTPEEAVAINCHMGAFDNERVGSSYEQFPVAWLLHVADEAATYLNNSSHG